MKKRLPPWCKLVKHTLIDKDMDVSELATKTGLARPYLSSIINGRIYSQPAVNKVSDCLGISNDYDAIYQPAKAAILWMWEHTKMIVNCLSVLYVLNWLYSLVVIVVAIKETGQFSYLDTLISETNETFRIVVGANIVKAGVENIFKYNDFGGKGSRYMETSNSENENIENVEDNRG